MGLVLALWIARARADWPVQPLAGPPRPVAIALGDLDGDGTSDIAVADASGVLSWTSLGGGTTPVGWLRGVTSIAVEDADLDGDLDVIAGSTRSPGVRWYANQGAGLGWTRHSPTVPVSDVVSVDAGSLGSDPLVKILAASGATAVSYWATSMGWTASLPAASRIRAVDLDGDGRRDVVALDGRTGTVRWRRGDLTPEAVVARVDGASAMEVVDLDRDGRPDLVLGSADEGWLVSLRNVGSAAFDPPRTCATGLTGLGELASADLDGDGDLDLVAAITGQNRVVALDGRGDGGLDPPRTLATARSPSDVAVGPIATSAPEVVVAADGGPVLLRSPGFPDADGDGLSDPTEAALGTDPSLADTDGDGLTDGQEVARGLDPVDADTDHGGLTDGQELAEHRDPSDRRDDWANRPMALPAGCSQLQVADVDGDRVPDLVHGDGVLAWRLGLGSGTYAAEVVGGEPTDSSAWLVGDLDGDGRADVVSGGRSGVQVWTRLAPGPPSVVALDVASAGGAALGDLDEDGDPELLLSTTRRTVVAFTRRADGSFRSTTLQVESDGLLAWADLDGDGHGDLVAEDGPKLVWAAGDGRGGFSRPVEIGARTSGREGLEVVDLDADGRPDLLVDDTTQSVSVLWNESGHFTHRTYPPTLEGSPGPLHAADVDGDALPDLVLGKRTQGEHAIWWWRNTGSRDFDDLLQASPVSRAEPGSLAVADLDADGDVDAVYCTVAGSPWTASNGVYEDRDHDGLSDAFELVSGTAVLRADTDGGGVRDGEERRLGTDPLDPSDDAAIDRDHDGLSDAEEALAGTDPYAFDSDGDGLSDGWERTLGLDPTVADTDGDGVVDGFEVDCGTDPLDPLRTDTDCDGLTDADELELGTDPRSSDTDRDGLTDADELELGTDPLDADSDDGGTLDGEEVATERDPGDATDDWAYHGVAGADARGPMALLDADGDGDEDLWTSTSAGHLTWIERLEGGRFGGSRVVWRGPRQASSLTEVDADGDGDRDLLVGMSDSAVWLLGEEGRFMPTDLGLGDPSLATAADLDGDGDLDVLGVSRSGCWSWLADGPLSRGGYEPATWHQAPGDLVAMPPSALVAADDALFVVRDAVAPTRATRVTGGADPPLAVVDLDGDGLDEIVFRKHGTGALASIRAIDGGWSDPEPFVELTGDPTDLVVAQLDGSGPPEMIAATTRGVVVVWLEPTRTVRLGRGAVDHVRVTDVDGDGAPDVVASGEEGTGWYRNAPWTPPGSTADTADTAAAAAGPRPSPPAAGCGCASGPVAPVGALGVALLTWRRRRR